MISTPALFFCECRTHIMDLPHNYHKIISASLPGIIDYGYMLYASREGFNKWWVKSLLSLVERLPISGTDNYNIGISPLLVEMELFCTPTEWYHDDVMKWKHFPRYWPFVRRIHRSPVNSSHKGWWHRALMLSLICTRINSWVNNGEAGDLRRHRAYCNVIVMVANISAVKKDKLCDVNVRMCFSKSILAIIQTN